MVIALSLSGKVGWQSISLLIILGKILSLFNQDITYGTVDLFAISFVIFVNAVDNAFPEVRITDP